MQRSDVTVILADGEFPWHAVPLEMLREAQTVICCDGAAAKLVASGIRMPDYVVGDLDSIDPMLLHVLEDRAVRFETQDTNDLTKAFEFAVAKGLTGITILGATGLREDHTLGNISLLVPYAERATVQLVTNYGRMVALSQTTTLASYPGQQISVFSLTPGVPITLRGLKWDVAHRPLQLWWEGTLNEALSHSFTVEFTSGKVVVFLQH